MSRVIADLISGLSNDLWREHHPFEPDFTIVQDKLYSASSSECAVLLNEWLGSSQQPCLFGRMAAKLGLLRYCVLTRTDLEKTDAEIGEIIQAARQAWKRDAWTGGASAFVILAVCPKISNSPPCAAIQQIAIRLAGLYLLRDVRVDEVAMDEIYLELPGKNRTTWRWDAGVNYFCAQGDGRWWHDHRIPSGMAFSINSVGHMVKSAILSTGMTQLARQLNAPDEEWDASNIDSLEKALAWAMRTINNAKETVSGRATKLLETAPSFKPPFMMPRDLSGKNPAEYLGYYHTDFSVPSLYFDPSCTRPSHVEPLTLDFTYLFREHVDNPAFVTMGEGVPIRADDDAVSVVTGEADKSKSRKSFGAEVDTVAAGRLREALGIN